MSRSEAEILEEMLRWLKFTGIQQAKEVVDDALAFEEDERKERDSRIAYELTDGENSQRYIAERISYSQVTVGNWQKKWSKLGIIDQSDGGKYEHLISLEELGLECPPIPQPDNEVDADEGEPGSETENMRNGSDIEAEEGDAEQATLDAAGNG